MQNITTTKYKFAQPKKTKKAQRDSDGNHMRVSAKRARRDDTTKSRKQRQQKKSYEMCSRLLSCYLPASFVSLFSFSALEIALSRALAKSILVAVVRIANRNLNN